MLYTINLYSTVCELHLSKTGRENIYIKLCKEQPAIVIAAVIGHKAVVGICNIFLHYPFLTSFFLSQH